MTPWFWRCRSADNHAVVRGLSLANLDQEALPDALMLWLS